MRQGDDHRSGQVRRGRARFWSALAAIAAIAALLAGWTLKSALLDWQEREQKRAELYWNGYAQLYVELNDGWEGLQERLDKDGYLYADELSFSIKVYDGSGEAKPVAAASRGSAADGGRKLPVLLRGEAVGYTEASLNAHEYAAFIPYGASSAVAALILGAGILTRRRLAAADATAERRLAANLTAFMERCRERLSGSGDAAADHEDMGLQEWSVLKREIGGLMLRNRKLETVRRTMVADIAHELRTPVSIMRAALDHALQSGVPLEPDRTAKLHDETLRLSRLVRELQELAQAESGHLTLFKSWFSLTELAREVLEALAAEGEERGIRCALSGFDETMVYGDRSRIRQILINLVGNALRHANALVTVDIALKESEIALAVGDDGPGIEEEELDRVFDRFYRGAEVRRGARERGTGLGLGLAIVREFARAHGGKAEARSRYGEGASFVVTLPVMKE